MNNSRLRYRGTEEMSIGRVREESTDSTFPECLDPLIVGRGTIGERLLIEFPVTRMDKSPYRSLDEESDWVRDRVIDDKWRDLEMLTELNRAISDVFIEMSEGRLHISLLHLDELICHRGRIEWSGAAELFHEVVYRTDMVDMSMGDTGSDDLLATTIREIWDRTVDTILILVRELETHIDDDHFIFVFESHTVETNLLRTTEWYDSQGSFFEGFGTLLWYMEKFSECLSWREKWIWSFWLEAILIDKWISRAEIGEDFFARVKEVAKSWLAITLSRTIFVIIFGEWFIVVHRYIGYRKWVVIGNRLL
jgi:hypothetical protein